MTFFPVSINYYSSDYPSFVILEKEPDSSEDISILLAFPLHILQVLIAPLSSMEMKIYYEDDSGIMLKKKYCSAK